MKSSLLVVLAAVFATGCASTPFTGIAIERARQEALIRGWQRVGDRYLPPDVELPPVEVGADINAALAARLAREEIARERGLSEYELALRVRPWAVRLGQAGDVALITGAAAALGWAVDRAIDGGGKGDFTQYNVNADRGGVVQIGNRDGNAARGGGNVAEGDGDAADK